LLKAAKSKTTVKAANHLGGFFIFRTILPPFSSQDATRHLIASQGNSIATHGNARRVLLYRHPGIRKPC
jgi:hypothetical protein